MNNYSLKQTVRIKEVIEALLLYDHEPVNIVIIRQNSLVFGQCSETHCAARPLFGKRFGCGSSCHGYTNR